MKAFIVSLVAIAVIAIGAAMALDRYQKPVDAAYVMPSSVRI
jgi:type II secretory pathway pseudopilin PulG